MPHRGTARERIGSQQDFTSNGVATAIESTAKAHGERLRLPPLQPGGGPSRKNISCKRRQTLRGGGTRGGLPGPRESRRTRVEGGTRPGDGDGSVATHDELVSKGKERSEGEKRIRTAEEHTVARVYSGNEEESDM